MRLLLPVLILDSMIAIAVEQPPQPAPVLALGWVPIELYRKFGASWGVNLEVHRRRNWIVDHFLLGVIPVLIPGGCVTWTNSPTIELVGRATIRRRLRYRDYVMK